MIFFNLLEYLIYFPANFSVVFYKIVTLNDLHFCDLKICCSVDCAVFLYDIIFIFFLLLMMLYLHSQHRNFCFCKSLASHWALVLEAFTNYFGLWFCVPWHQNSDEQETHSLRTSSPSMIFLSYILWFIFRAFLCSHMFTIINTLKIFLPHMCEHRTARHISMSVDIPCWVWYYFCVFKFLTDIWLINFGRLAVK